MNDWNTGPEGGAPPHRPDHNRDRRDPWAPPREPTHAHYDDPMLRSSNGTTVLVLGILSWLMCGIFTAIPGFIIARSDRAAIQAGMMAPDSSLEAGYWLNLIALVFAGFALCFYFVVIVVAILTG